jgi:hypothetical protein
MLIILQYGHYSVYPDHDSFQMTNRLLFSRNNAKIILLYNPTQEHLTYYITQQV